MTADKPTPEQIDAALCRVYVSTTFGHQPGHLRKWLRRHRCMFCWRWSGDRALCCRHNRRDAPYG